jgi:hypothetical protein
MRQFEYRYIGKVAYGGSGGVVPFPLKLSSGQHVPTVVLPDFATGINCIAGWLGINSPSARVGDENSFLPLFEFEPWIVQPVFQSYRIQGSALTAVLVRVIYRDLH